MPETCFQTYAQFRRMAPWLSFAPFNFNAT
jgi:hypothetical protein